jgi:formamidopyrimidine-DNA glycosylase
MPEAPDLEVIKDFLNERISGQPVERAQVLRPMMVRSLASEDFAADVIGHTFGTVARHGKMLTLPLEPDRVLAVHPMLTGALQYCLPATKVTKRAFFILGMPGADLRYLDERQMGMVYYVRPDQLEQVPRLEEGGPDVLDAYPEYDAFVAGLKPFQGEIKGILTRGGFLSGIGNAYADEVLFAAGVSPFKRRRELAPDQLQRLHDAIPRILGDAIAVLRERMPPDIHVKVRDFLQVHNKGGEACPRCGHSITQLTANQRITSYCRRCQPGSLIKN